MQEEVRKIISGAVKEIWGLEAPSFAVEIPSNNFGDYATNVAFGLAKALKKSPAQIAETMTTLIGSKRIIFLSEVKAINGYINFFLSANFLTAELECINKEGLEFGKSTKGRGQKVIIEFSQPNIAKPLHAGHLRNTILGEAIARIHDFLGYETVRWNYLGDWGTQFGKVIAAYKLLGDKKKVMADPVNELVNLYIKFNEEAQKDETLEKKGQEESKKLEEGDEKNRKLWQWFKDETLKSLEKIYQRLGVKFDNFIGESFYESHLKPLTEQLVKKGVAVEGEGGALIIELPDLPPALIRKSDGVSLYLTRDIANLKYRVEEFNPARIIYVVGAEQSLHFQQLFAIAKILDITDVELIHLKYGLVLGEDGKKLSTRQGNAIDINEIIDKAIQLARKVVEEKNSDLSETEKENIARVVGLGALKYELLKDHRNSNIVFSWDRMLDFSGNSAPYLQYSYARLMSIIRKGDHTGQPDYGQLKEGVELNIIKHLLNYPAVILETEQYYTTNGLALYLFELANLVNRFYESIRILTDENESRKAARLVLIKTAAGILKSGLELLGIDTLERV